MILGNFTPQLAQQKYINHTFVAFLLDLLKSPDPRERDYLKTIVHRIYGKFMQLRFGIRMTIARELLMVGLSESTKDRTFGIAEYLEILVPIIDGFSESIRVEHR